MSGLVLRRVEVDGEVVDVVIDDGFITAMGDGLPVPAGATVLDADGGALIPGLWDHHIHLVALAAARRSVHVGPPDVHDVEELAATLADHRPADPAVWVRAVGYHESVAGPIDRHDLDRLLPGIAARVQHRSGAMWVLSGEAIARIGIEDEHLDGLERDAGGALTGRLYGGDRWLREKMSTAAPDPPPDLAIVGRELASYGVVGVTDATPYEAIDDLRILADAGVTGALPQHIVATGGPPLTTDSFPTPLRRGPVKLLLVDHSLPTFDDLVSWMIAAHEEGRPVAVHCVTLTSLALTLAALDEARSMPGDRIEHGAVVPPELREAMRRHRLTVVTQPNFVAERGDRYLVDVDATDRPHLYPCRSLVEHGVAVAGSTDAPFGHPDPWRAIAAAVRRRTAGGRPLGLHEAVVPEAALGLLLGTPEDPGGTMRRVEPGAAADLCLLHGDLAGVLADPAADSVRATVIAGTVVYGS